ncbi:hypothetical protein ACFW1A_11740 [Kitasatospora sp. NPDC058965]|uniref:hypothetical protein n=1 Tax=Kitasatospora sp. NPDC058965 TaxID=3346682 RepID=UPI00368A062E
MGRNPTAPDDGPPNDIRAAIPEQAPPGAGGARGVATEHPVGDPRATVDPRCLDPERVQRLQAEWHTLQAGFVDDPARAVEHADALVQKSLRLIGESVTARRTELGGARPEQQSLAAGTEELRVALRQYRALLERLLQV